MKRVYDAKDVITAVKIYDYLMTHRPLSDHQVDEGNAHINKILGRMFGDGRVEIEERAEGGRGL